MMKKYKIPFIVHIVPWPGLPFSDIERTIRYAEENDAYAVRLILPEYGKYFSGKKKYNMNEHWEKVVDHFYPLSNKYAIPIYIDPIGYVQNYIYGGKDLPRIVGIIKNSPAYECGIKPHDLIKTINGRPIDSIEGAMEILKNNLNHKIALTIEREKAILEFEMKISKRANIKYPYISTEIMKTLPLWAPFGLLLTNEYFSHEVIFDVERYINVHNAKEALVLVSARARPFIKYLLNKYKISRATGAGISLVVVRNQYFGRSIDEGYRLVVEDYIRAIRQRIKVKKPDLIILPSSPFSNWGRDLTGRVNLDIERAVGIPVEFVYN